MVALLVAVSSSLVVYIALSLWPRGPVVDTLPSTVAPTRVIPIERDVVMVAPVVIPTVVSTVVLDAAVADVTRPQATTLPVAVSSPGTRIRRRPDRVLPREPSSVAPTQRPPPTPILHDPWQ
jgi:hypothetical protein